MEATGYLCLRCTMPRTLAVRGVMLRRRAERNAEGGFFQIFQQNKWRLRKQKEAAAARRDKELSLL